MPARAFGIHVDIASRYDEDMITAVLEWKRFKAARATAAREERKLNAFVSTLAWLRSASALPPTASTASRVKPLPLRPPPKILNESQVDFDGGGVRVAPMELLDPSGHVAWRIESHGSNSKFPVASSDPFDSGLALTTMRIAEAPRVAPSTTPHLHRGVSEKSVCAAFAAESWCDDHHEAALFIQRIFQLRRKRRKHRIDQIRFTPKYPHSQLSASARVIQVYWRQRQRQKLYARFVKGEKRLFVQRPSASAELNAAAGFMSSLASRQASQGKVRRSTQLIRRAAFLRSSAKLLRAGAQAGTPPLATPPSPSLPNLALLPQAMPKGGSAPPPSPPPSPPPPPLPPLSQSITLELSRTGALHTGGSCEAIVFSRDLAWLWLAILCWLSMQVWLWVCLAEDGCKATEL